MNQNPSSLFSSLLVKYVMNYVNDWNSESNALFIRVIEVEGLVPLGKSTQAFTQRS